jgi:hypothetical protein
VDLVDAGLPSDDSLIYELTTPEGRRQGSCTRKDTDMTSLRTRLDRHRSLRAHLRDDRALDRAMAAAPTLESAHEIAALAARR